jgi:hypothetical protein
MDLLSFYNTVTPLEKITSFSSSGLIPELMISEGILVHTYSTVNNVDKIIAAIKAGRSAPAPEIPPVKQQDATDELKKFKALLDDGIITQEDFDKKKARLSGL